jgi:pimeloyl-ACP methyl ester carboxylesterase
MASAEWSEENVSIAGIELRVIKGGSGKPLLILHDELGYPGWLSWQTALAQERTLVIPQAPGFGRTPRLEWIESMRDLACVYARLLREQRLSDLDVIGFSFGGWLAAEMMANDPQQFRHVLLVAPGGIKASEGEIADLFQTPARTYLMASVLDPSATPEFSQLYGGESTPQQYEAWEEARAQFARLAWQPYFHNPSLPYLLEGITGVPTLLLWGCQDRIIPRSVIERYKRVLARSQLVTFEQCGHRPEIEKTEQFVNEVKKFLAA